LEPGGRLLLENEVFYEEVLVKIGIIGAGNIGATLTRRLTALGHQVAVANSRGPGTLSELADETGATAVVADEVANGADLVIVTIPQKAIPLLPAGILDGAAVAAPIVDTGNYYPARDGRIDPIESGVAESRWVSEQLGRPVVKAFNTIRAQHLLELGKPAGSPGRIALPVAGDDPNSKRTVMELVDALGFDPIDAGTIDESWRQQPGKPVYAADLDAAGVTRALAEASPERPENFRA
jgi:8-hydroxy-5-deazaflavin:NADPH oxidoreductase